MVRKEGGKGKKKVEREVERERKKVVCKERSAAIEEEEKPMSKTFKLSERQKKQ